MANMSYCRFQNIVEDLEDCFDHFDDYGPGATVSFSLDEEKARKKMIRVCVDVALNYGHEIGKNIAWTSVGGNGHDD